MLTSTSAANRRFVYVISTLIALLGSLLSGIAPSKADVARLCDKYVNNICILRFTDTTQVLSWVAPLGINQVHVRLVGGTGGDDLRGNEPNLAHSLDFDLLFSDGATEKERTLQIGVGEGGASGTHACPADYSLPEAKNPFGKFYGGPGRAWCYPSAGASGAAATAVIAQSVTYVAAGTGGGSSSRGPSWWDFDISARDWQVGDCQHDSTSGYCFVQGGGGGLIGGSGGGWAAGASGQSGSVPAVDGLVMGSQPSSPGQNGYAEVTFQAAASPNNVTVQGHSTSLHVSWDAVTPADQNAIITYTASAGSDSLSCTTTDTSCDITGLTNGETYSVTVTASDGTNTSQPSPTVSGMPGVPPGAPTGVHVVTGGGQAQVSWSAPTTGSPLTNLSYSVTSSPGAFTCTTTSTTCMVSGLTNGRAYTFSVVASTVVGLSDPAKSDWVTPGTTPDQVAGLNNVARSSSSVTVGWSTPNSNGAGISDYLIRTSSDGSTWSAPIDTVSTSTSYVIIGLSSASARLVQVAAKNSKGQGPWSDSFLTTTKGAKLVRVTVQDSSGQPVTGGAITWRMVDNSAWSAKTYGLTADGIIDFPYAPAGEVNVTLTNGQLADGSTVNGSWSSVLGFTSTLLTVPSNSAYAARTVHVQLPNGYPVANVKVTVSGNGMTSTRNAGGFRFTQPTSATTGFTDASGNFTVTGYWTGVPSANTLYNDGIIVQQQDNDLVGSTTTVELDYMPWVSFDTSQVLGDAGAPQVVQVSAVDTDSAQLLGRHYVTSQPVKAGVAVTLVPPKGVKAAKCSNGKSQKLSGVTGANGKAALTICAYQSGVYTLKTSGAASVGSIRVLVKGAAPLAPTSVNVTSPVVGQLRASWNKPLYDGGSPITQYTVTASAPGKPTVTKVIKATVSKTGAVTKAPATLQVLTGLSNATVYTVTVSATTKNGTSNAYTAKVPVA